MYMVDSYNLVVVIYRIKLILVKIMCKQGS